MSVWLNVCPAFSRKFHIYCIPPPKTGQSKQCQVKNTQKSRHVAWNHTNTDANTGIKLGRNSLLDGTNCRWTYHMRFIWHDTVGRIPQYCTSHNVTSQYVTSHNIALIISGIGQASVLLLLIDPNIILHNIYIYIYNTSNPEC